MSLLDGDMFNTMHLFAGAGGGLLADLILGHTPIVAVEWDAYACAVLRERAADGWFHGLHVHEGDVRMFDPSPYQGRVDCIHAGFPCQDISVAGCGAGIDGERSGLYREVIRCISVVRPPYVFLENSPAIVGRGLGTVLADLAACGYDARWTVLAASDVGAPHQRERWWCLSYRPDANRERRAEQLLPTKPSKAGQRSGGGHAPWFGQDWDAHVAAGLASADGLANRVDQVRCCGNGQVPLCAATAWCLLGGPMNHEAPPNAEHHRDASAAPVHPLVGLPTQPGE